MRFEASLLVTVVLASAALEGQEPKLGSVHFATSCSTRAQPIFNRAVALLHSFEFNEATQGFRQVLAADSTCGIAYWGIALSNWGNPAAPGNRSPELIAAGLDAVTRGRAIGAKTSREKAYIGAVGSLYDDASTIDQRTRFAVYRDVMHGITTTYPDDVEARIFYALALAMSADPADKSYAKQLEAGKILDSLVKKYPEHPGIAHYIIHTYDLPPLASHALNAAGRYSVIAPAAPHALHMPSHTFTRVGYWDQSIESNLKASAAARIEKAGAEELHDSDYLMYAYLQSCRDRDARELLDRMPAMFARFDPARPSSAAPPLAGFYGLAAMPARYALERGSWRDAAILSARKTRFPFTDAITYFARALGAARSGDTSTAVAAIAELNRLRDELTRQNEKYWSEQTEIQIRGASAWLALAQGKKDEALALMNEAANRESATEKSAVTPGPIAPARELLGEMLLQLNRPREALAQFQRNLEIEPRRYRSVGGAARSAALIGDQRTSRKFSAQMKELCGSRTRRLN
jgi:tetratricopeptide (TPR) repeat protein